ncbi:MAG TPA: hypothetical protein VF288_12440 [Mycobacteriales bacterium]
MARRRCGRGVLAVLDEAVRPAVVLRPVALDEHSGADDVEIARVSVVLESVLEGQWADLSVDEQRARQRLQRRVRPGFGPAGDPAQLRRARPAGRSRGLGEFAVADHSSSRRLLR